MTISTTASKVVCLGNGSTSVFAYNFLIPLSTEVVVIYTDTLGNSQTLSTSQYTITGIGNPAGGLVTYPTSGSPIAFGTTLTIQRVVPLVQNTSISNQGAFYPNVVETGLDTATMQIQQLNTAIINSLQVPVTDSSAPTTLPGATQRAGQMLGFDSQGNPIAAQPGSALVSSVMQPFVSAVSLAAAANLLGLPVFIGVGTTTGTANAQVLAGTVPGTFAFTAGNKIAAIPGFTNSGPMTLTVGAIPPTNVFKRSAAGPVALVGGEVVANQLVNFTCDGTQYILEEQGKQTFQTFGGTQTINATAGQAIGVAGTPVSGSSAMFANSVNPSTGAASFISFNRAAAFAANFGIDTDNYLKVGGWSFGANAYKLLHEGLDTGTFTGSYTFSGTVNITGAIQRSGVAFPITKAFESSQQTITAGGALTLAHGLGVSPKLIYAALICLTADRGYVTGNEVPVALNLQSNDNVTYTGIAVSPDATNLNCRYGASNGTFDILHATSGTSGQITNANWKLVLRAWA